MKFVSLKQILQASQGKGEIVYDTGVPLLDIYPREMITYVQIKASRKMFTALCRITKMETHVFQ